MASSRVPATTRVIRKPSWFESVLPQLHLQRQHRRVVSGNLGAGLLSSLRLSKRQLLLLRQSIGSWKATFVLLSGSGSGSRLGES